MNKLKVRVIVDYVGESRNSTPYVRLKTLCENYDVDIYMRKKSLIENSEIKAKNYYKYDFKLMLNHAVRKKYNIVYTFGVHNYMLAYMIKYITQGKLVIDIFDDIILSKETIRTKSDFASKIKYALLSAMVIAGKIVIKKSDVVFLTLNEKIIDFYPKRKRGYIKLTNGIWEELIKDNSSKIKVRNSKINITYVGYVRRDRGMIKILETTKILNRQYGLDFHVHLAGPISEEDNEFIDNYLKENGLNNLTIYGFVDYQKVLELLSNTDIALYLFPIGKRELDYIYPIKIFEYASFGINIVATKGEGIKELSRAFNDNIHLVDYDSADIADTISDIASNSNIKRNIPKKLDEFTWEEINSKFLLNIEKIL